MRLGAFAHCVHPAGPVHAAVVLSAAREQGASEGAGQVGGNGQARHEAGQAVSKNNLTEERSPGTMRRNQHEQDDDTTQSTSTAITASRPS